jgi:hypothetical protein
VEKSGRPLSSALPGRGERSAPVAMPFIVLFMLQGMRRGLSLRAALSRAFRLRLRIFRESVCADMLVPTPPGERNVRTGRGNRLKWNTNGAARQAPSTGGNHIHVPQPDKRKKRRVPQASSHRENLRAVRKSRTPKTQRQLSRSLQCLFGWHCVAGQSWAEGWNSVGIHIGI